LVEYSLLCWFIILLNLVFKGFIMTGCWKMKDFSVFIKLIMWFLLSILFTYCIKFIVLHILNFSVISGMKATWPCHMIFLMNCWNLFEHISLGILSSTNIKYIVVLFWCCPY
jgi:hypothetical protein